MSEDCLGMSWQGCIRRLSQTGSVEYSLRNVTVCFDSMGRSNFNSRILQLAKIDGSMIGVGTNINIIKHEIMDLSLPLASCTTPPFSTYGLHESSTKITNKNEYLPLEKNLPIDIVNREVALFVKLGFSQGREMHYPRVHVHGWILHIHPL